MARTRLKGRAGRVLDAGRVEDLPEMEVQVVNTRGHSERIEFSGDCAVNYKGHIARYFFALDAIPDISERLVLDVPCGIGYGSKILARKAREVVGIDISEDALAKGREKYLTVRGERKKTDNLSLLRMDAQHMDFADDTFDAGVSFEGIEHVPDAGKMVSEVCRVLKPGATFVVSTPNREMTRQKGGKPHNPFHIQEFTRDELADMLSPHFSEIEFWGQDIVEARNMWKRNLYRFMGALDVFDLRHRLVPEKALAAVREDVYGSVRIRKVDEDKGEKPRVWIAVCR
ncbi:MAG: class I SAM-dependent methyltransferase [Candidatus Altiarchaeota archaeon]